MAKAFEISVENININSSQDNIETWDSLQHLNLVLALEQTFGVRFTPEEISEMKTLSIVLTTLENRLRARSL